MWSSGRHSSIPPCGSSTINCPAGTWSPCADPDPWSWGCGPTPHSGRTQGCRRSLADTLGVRGLQVLSGVADRVDGPTRLGALAAGDERADVDDPLALLAGDARSEERRVGT